MIGEHVAGTGLEIGIAADLEPQFGHCRREGQALVQGAKDEKQMLHFDPSPPQLDVQIEAMLCHCGVERPLGAFLVPSGLAGLLNGLGDIAGKLGHEPIQIGIGSLRRQKNNGRARYAPPFSAATYMGTRKSIGLLDPGSHRQSSTRRISLSSMFMAVIAVSGSTRSSSHEAVDWCCGSVMRRKSNE